MQEDRTCACGCGTVTQRRWVLGHNPKFAIDRETLVEQLRSSFRDAGVPYGYCCCGCGERTPIARKSLSRLGRVQGEPIRYRHGHHARKTEPEFLVDTLTGCWVWQRAVDRDGYGAAYRGGRKMRAHRVYYEDVVGPIPAGHVLHHKCERPGCVNPDHLEPLLPYQHTRVSRSSKLTYAQACEARKLRSLGLSFLEVGRRFGVTEGTIRALVKGRTWRQADGAGFD